MRRAERVRAGLRDRRRRRRALRAAAALLGLGGATTGFAGTTLASNILRFHRANGAFTAHPVVEVEPEELDGWQIPRLAEQLGVEIVALRIFGPDHIVLAVVEAEDIEVVREFVVQSRLIQWNTTRIHASYSMEEALVTADALEAIF